LEPEEIHVEALDTIAEAAAKIARLEPRLQAARRELHAGILDAAAKGVSPAVIARVAGLSRQRVQQILRSKPSA